MFVSLLPRALPPLAALPWAIIFRPIRAFGQRALGTLLCTVAGILQFTIFRQSRSGSVFDRAKHLVHTTFLQSKMTPVTFFRACFLFPHFWDAPHSTVLNAKTFLSQLRIDRTSRAILRCGKTGLGRPRHEIAVAINCSPGCERCLRP